MDETEVLKNYFLLFDKFENLINETNKRFVIANSSDYFFDNINFFNKSFMVLSCAYLESYLKDVGMLIIEEMNKRLKANPVPHNLIKWNFYKNNFKENDAKFVFLDINISRKDIDDEISGNVGRTINFFWKMGIDLKANSEFQNQVDRIKAIVAKRNTIIHDNDDASDLTPSDIIENIELIKKYITIIDKEVINHISFANNSIKV